LSSIVKCSNLEKGPLELFFRFGLVTIGAGLDSDLEKYEAHDRMNGPWLTMTSGVGGWRKT
jgi:hypothetical protein